MVARIVCGKNIKGLLLYNENKVQEGKAEFIHASKFGLEVPQLTVDEKLRRFQKLFALNKRVKTNAIHISLNFDRSDKLNREKLIAIGSAYMEKIGFGDQPFLVYEHKDAAHPHLHIVSTNIDNTGKRINLHNIGKTKSETARRELEEAFGLVKAEGREQVHHNLPKEIAPAVYGQSETKRTISNIVREVARTYKYSSLPEFNAALKHYNVIADRGFEGTAMFERGGLAYSIIDKDGRKIGVPLKASSLAGKPTLKFLEQQFKLNKVLRKKAIVNFRDKVNAVLNAAPKDLQQFSKELGKDNIDLVVRINKDGRVYGLTYVDHKSRCVLNGSDLGKAFTANGIMARIDKQSNPGARKNRNIQREKFREVDSVGKAVHDNAMTLPAWLTILSQADQVHSHAPYMSNSKRKRRKKRGRSIN